MTQHERSSLVHPFPEKKSIRASEVDSWFQNLLSDLAVIKWYDVFLLNRMETYRLPSRRISFGASFPIKQVKGLRHT